VRRFVEVGVPGYHIEDQKPGREEVRPPGRQGAGARGRADQALSAARFQLDIMGVPGHHRRAHRRRVATLLDGRSDERDQPFILGATNTSVPTYKACFLAMLRRFYRGRHRGAERARALRGLRRGVRAADAWLDEARPQRRMIAEAAWPPTRRAQP
jgi:isocitrate lyase